MKNKKLNLEIIESGRLSKKECSSIFGGGIECLPLHNVLCAAYTNCTKQTYGNRDKDEVFTSLCNYREGYSECSWFVLYSPYGVNCSANIYSS